MDERTSVRTHVRIEKELFIGFYSIRKLLDTFKISDTSKAMRFDLAFHPTIRQVDHFNWHHLDKNFNLLVRGSETRNIRFLCDRFIHSYVFLASEADNRLDGFFVATDHDRHSKCYFVELSQVLKAFRTIGRDYPAQAHLWRGQDGQWEGQVG